MRGDDNRAGELFSYVDLETWFGATIRSRRSGGVNPARCRVSSRRSILRSCGMVTRDVV